MTTCIDTPGAFAAGPRAGANRPTPLHRVGHRWMRLWRAASHGLAALGVGVLAIVALLLAQPQLRAQLERGMADWLLERHAALTLGAEIPASAAAERPAAMDPQALPPEQQRVTQWLARKYRVASEPLAALVAEAHQVGRQLRLDPALILAVMAIESRFNPYAASPFGAHGLMQVHTRVHADKFDDLGGTLAAFDPLSNLRVGAQILRDAIRTAGSVPGGLRLYVGAVSVDARDYIVKVMAEQERLKRVAAGQQVGFTAPMPLPPGLEADDAARGASHAAQPFPISGASAVEEPPRPVAARPS
ncbi:lytic transglycosylase domain-containing protein [Tepidimonas sp.]|uniref:lytic transglycosylase domain-containing protein n=1 Tax=Tepidimonas sp. TaxID=2002775 RepID=UPI0028CF203A|nr:lytic transglycosylase domain-containing protein [Tepidimonas sp.]MDT7928612.1 lytic transglycosylase domain-containing protein [Tepidimonas sp.]